MESGLSHSTQAPIRDTQVYFSLFHAPYDMLVDKVSINVTTSQASSTTKIGVYSNRVNKNSLYPDRLLWDSGSLSSASTGVKTSTVPLTLTANTLYWIASINGGSAANPTYRAAVAGSQCAVSGVGTGAAYYNITYTHGMVLPPTMPEGATAVGNRSLVVAFRARELGEFFEGNIKP
jgi:hypothetical protein